MRTYLLPLFPRSDGATRMLVRAACLATVVLGSASIVCAQSAPPLARPGFDTIRNSLLDYFDSLRDYKPGDLVTRSLVADALEQVVSDTGWQPPKAEAIEQLALPDNSFISRQLLSTPSGRQFMRQIARFPGAYSQLDRLSTISGGQKFIKDLIAKKGGYEMIEYLTTTRGGHNLGKMMAGVPDGVDLNKPTGRIYTADDLLTALKTAYADSAP